MDEPSLEEINALVEPAVIEFGASWCGYCQAAQADIAAVLKQHPTVRHIKVEDGKGKRLGRHVHDLLGFLRGPQLREDVMDAVLTIAVDEFAHQGRLLGVRKAEA